MTGSAIWAINRHAGWGRTCKRQGRTTHGSIAVRYNGMSRPLQAWGYPPPIQDPRLNEIEYFNIAQLYEQQHGVVVPTDREGFVEHLPRTFSAWAKGEIEETPETFQAFETRVSDALRDIGTEGGPAIVVTSGGLISMVVRQAMGLDIPAMARVALAIMNTSMHRLHPIGAQLSPVLFNAVPHLEAPDRQFAQTHL